MEKTLRVRYTGDPSGALAAQRAIDKGNVGLSRSLRKVGRGMSNVGRSMTRYVTTPLLAAAGASVKLSLDFEDSMQKIAALVGINQRQVDSWSKELIELGPQLGKAPAELAKGLYFVTSAGIDAADAMGVLTAGAKASAAGLGDTMTVVDAVTSAVNAYGIKNLSAARATDVMTAAIRLGKLEADALAPVIGRVIPVAANMGVEFEEVGGALAAMSLQGLDAAEATTALRGIMVNFLKPAEQTREQLQKFGLTTADVRKSIREDGLLVAMQDLADRIGDNEEAVGRLIPEKRALVGFLNLTGKNAAHNAKVMRELAASTGETEKAFGKMAQTTGFQLKQAFAELQSAGIELGDALAPAIRSLAKWVGDLARGWRDLSPAAQNFIIKAGAVAIALGPVLRLTGGLTRGIGGLIGLFSRGGRAKDRFARNLAGTLTPAAQGASKATGGLANKIGAFTSTATGGSGALAFLGTTAAAAGPLLGALGLVVALYVDEFKEFGKNLGVAAESVAKTGWASEQSADALSKVTVPARFAGAAYAEVGRRSDAATQSTRDFVFQLRDVIGPVGANTKAMIESAVAAGDQARAQAIVNSAINQFFARLPDTSKRTGELASKQQLAANMAYGHRVRTDELKAALERLPREVRTNILLPGLTTGNAGVGQLLNQLRILDRTNPTSTVTVTTRRIYRSEYQQFGAPSQRQHGGLASGMTLVGEAGPEVLRLPAGSRVYTTGRSRAMVGDSWAQVERGLDRIAKLLERRDSRDDGHRRRGDARITVVGPNPEAVAAAVMRRIAREV